MATTDVKIIRINQLISSIDPKQIAIEPSNNAISGIKDLGFKDADGNERHCATIDANARLVDLEVTGDLTATISSDNVTEGTTNKFVTAAQQTWLTNTGDVDAVVDAHKVLYGTTITTSVSSNTDILAETLGDTDYPTVGPSNLKSWHGTLTAVSYNDSDRNVLSKWLIDISFVEIDAYSNLGIYDHMIQPLYSANTNAVLTPTISDISIDINEVKITVQHTSTSSVKAEILWILQFTESDTTIKWIS